MLMGEGQAQQWMKTANWDGPEKYLRLQIGNQPAELLYDQAGQLLNNFG